MSFLNVFRNLASFFQRKYNQLHEYLFGPPPVPPINVTIIHVTKITLDPKDTIEGVPVTLPPEQFQQALAEATARETAVMKHNMLSDSLLRNPRAAFEEETSSYWFSAIVGSSSLAAIMLGVYFLAPSLLSMSLLGNVIGFGVGYFAKSWGLNAFYASLLSMTCRLLWRVAFCRRLSQGKGGQIQSKV